MDLELYKSRNQINTCTNYTLQAFHDNLLLDFDYCIFIVYINYLKYICCQR